MKDGEQYIRAFPGSRIRDENDVVHSVKLIGVEYGVTMCDEEWTVAAHPIPLTNYFTPREAKDHENITCFVCLMKELG